MKRMLLLILPLLGLLPGCKVGVGDIKEAFLRSYVMYYYDTDGIELVGWPEEKELRIVFTNLSNTAAYDSSGEQKEKYDALCEKYGDMAYNRKFVIWDGAGPNYTRSLGVGFTSIKIVSNADFDNQHSAGQSLGDIITFDTWSLEPYVASGYKLKTGINDNNYSRLTGLLSEVTPDDKLTLLGYRYPNHTAFINLWIDYIPTLDKTHTFTVTMTADDGRVFSNTIDMTFE